MSTYRLTVVEYLTRESSIDVEAESPEAARALWGKHRWTLEESDEANGGWYGGDIEEDVDNETECQDVELIGEEQAVQ